MSPIDPADDPARTAGPAERLLHLGGNLLALTADAGRTRLELFAAELAVERQRLMRLFALGMICGITSLLGLAFTSFWVIAFFWDTHRLIAAAAVALVYLAIAVIAGLWLRQSLAQTSTSFAQTVDALRRDYESLRTRLHRDAAATGDSDSSREVP